jgi:hypothetical protein
MLRWLPPKSATVESSYAESAARNHTATAVEPALVASVEAER